MNSSFENWRARQPELDGDEKAVRKDERETRDQPRGDLDPKDRRVGLRYGYHSYDGLHCPPC
jgi:hypothetical protein